ncbi:MAG: PQQ-binding-like beta-propeller repeat protein [Bifidobacteriaceae bacterium]|jgi:hypothetical protein|nr:PQQ-binding-like beta-propeller repeat protein [Bifidobacteriaceae bacterium]
MAFDPAQGEWAAHRLLADRDARGADLVVVARSFPRLVAEVAAHPNLPPELERWLRALRRADVDAALDGRRARGAGAPPAGTPAPSEPGLWWRPPLAGGSTPPAQWSAAQWGPGGSALAAVPPSASAAASSSAPAAASPSAPAAALPGTSPSAPAAASSSASAAASLSAPAATRGGRRRWPLALVAAVIAVTAGWAVWFAAQRPEAAAPGRPQTSDPGQPQAPGTAGEATIAPLVDLRDLLPDWDNPQFTQFIDDDNFLVMQRPRDAWSSLSLAAVNVNSPGAPAWTLDLAPVLGAAAGTPGELDLSAADSRGNMIFKVRLADEDGRTGQPQMVAVSAQGRVLSHHLPDNSLWNATLAGEVVLVRTTEIAPDHEAVEARALDDLGTLLWRASCGEWSCLVTDLGEETWVVTPEGVLDAATGRAVGFERSVEPSTQYLLADGDLLFVAFHGGSFGGPEKLMRVGRDGQELWDEPVALSGWVGAGDGRLYLLDGADVIAVDADTGAERWRQRVSDAAVWGRACLAGNGNVASNGDSGYLVSVTVLDGSDGEVISNEGEGLLFECAYDVVYLLSLDGAALSAYSAERVDDPQLWTLVLGQATGSTWPIAHAGRLYVIESVTVSGDATAASVPVGEPDGWTFSPIVGEIVVKSVSG